MKKKVLIFGAGGTGQVFYGRVKDEVEVLGFLDNEPNKWGQKKEGLPIFGTVDALKEISFDEIIVATLTGVHAVKKQLLEAGIDSAKINTTMAETPVKARVNFLDDFSKMYHTCIPPHTSAEELCVAEGGVFQGEFAKEINRNFPELPLYLFDTFEGFDERDVEKEHSDGFSNEDKGHLNMTSEDLVLSKMPYKEKVVLKKGYFPETVAGLENKRFVFVNLDFDLYNPILAGIEFFYPRMVEHGILLIHDYFNPGYKGVEQAVKDYEDKHDTVLAKMPIGDNYSLAIMKI